MTETPDPTRPPDQPPEEPGQPPEEPDRPPEEPDRPPAGEPTEAITSVMSVTAAPEPAPAPAAAEHPGAGGPEVMVSTTDAAAAHTVANPSPIPDYAMEPSVEAPSVEAPSVEASAAPAPGADDAPTQRFSVDPGLTVPLALEPQPLPPEPPSLTPVPPRPVGPEPAYLPASVRPRRPLIGTIIWGVLLLALAGFVLLGVLLPTPADPTLWLLGGVIVIGLLLIVIGIIAALRRAG